MAQPAAFGLADLHRLAAVAAVHDFHRVSGWSVYGVRSAELLDRLQPRPGARAPRAAAELP